MRPINPAWRKAPLLLFRFRGLAAAVIVGAAILGLASAARPSFLASSGRAALDQQLNQVNRWGAGLRVSRYGPLFGDVRILEFGEEMQIPLAPGADFDLVPLEEMVDDVTSRLDEATQGIQNLDHGSVMMVGSEVALDGRQGPVRGRLITRTNALENVTKLADSGDEGVWITDITAKQIDASPGDTVEIALGEATTSVPIAGVYRYLAHDRRRDYWAPAQEFIYREAGDFFDPPALVIAPQELFMRAAEELSDTGLIQWNHPVSAGTISLPEARSMGGDLTALIRRRLSSEDSEIFRALATEGGYGSSERWRATAMPAMVGAADRRVQSLRGPVDVLSIAAVLVALVVMGAAGFYLVQRRRVEFVYLASRGLSPRSLGLKAALESLVPATVGCAVGLLLGVPLSGLVGPGGDVPVESVPDSLRASGVALLVGLAVVGVVVALTTEREAGDEPHGWIERLKTRLSWEPIMGVAGLIVLWRVLQGNESIGQSGSATINIDVLLLPAVGILGGAGVAARVLRWWLPRLTRRARQWSPTRFLAAKRLAGSPRAAVALVTACAFSLAVLMYSTTLARSTRTTVLAKAQIFTGSDFSAELAQSPATPALPVPSTYVVKFQRISLAPGDRTARVLGIDPSTFADAAYWEDSFSSQPLRVLLRDLGEQRDDGINAITVGGGFQTDLAFQGGGQTLPVNVVGTARSFPGQLGRTPMFVVEKDALEELAGGMAGATGGRRDEVWARGAPAAIERVLNEHDVLYFSTNSVAEALEAPSLQSLLWSLGLLQTLGIAAGVISVAGLVLYLQARERATTVVRALTRRMRLSSRGYRTMLILEVGGLLGTAFVLGAGLGLGVSILLLDRFDLNPSLPPSQLVQMPVVPLVITAVVIAGTAMVSASRMQRRADRANVAELMRVV
jgi:putative ABC transport system permease protein